METLLTPEIPSKTVHRLKDKTQIRASDIPYIIDYYGDNIKVLSLDCFDTLLWRNTATPKDVFSKMEQRPLFQSLGITAQQRIAAATRAYRKQFISTGTREITLRDIYRQFTALTPTQQEALVAEEVLAEIDVCYGFPLCIDLIRSAKKKNIKIVVVSNTYLEEPQLRQLLATRLPSDVMNAIDTIFCSSDYRKSKNDGLFNHVLEKLDLPAWSILHIGDHKSADFDAPSALGFNALHLLQFEHNTTDFLRMQHNALELAALTNPAIAHLHPPRHSPFRGIFALNETSAAKPETLIGYLSFGPILYAFARFISDEIADMRAAGKQPKVFFLLRDAHLLANACAAYAGQALGKCVHIRKFGTVAASFRTQEDVDHYLVSLAPQYYNLWVICSQLLLPHDVATSIINLALQSPNPEKAFHEIIHREEILKFIFLQSAAYRERLKKYILKELDVKPGDTVVLVDVGYVGVTQEFLTRALQEELGIEIIGRYLIASHDPNRPPSKALITSTACDHGLFEQSCTLKEGSVIDYADDGSPIYDQIRLSDDQYNRVNAIQAECLRFIRDAKRFFTAANIELPYPMLQAYALAALRRHVYLPLASEIEYFQAFQHDKDMGPSLNKTIFNLKNGALALQQGNLAININPYEARAENLQLALSAMVQRTFDLDITQDDISFRTEMIKIINKNVVTTTEAMVKAVHTNDGYYSFCAPAVGNATLSIEFGLNYQWLQIISINLISPATSNNINFNKNIVLEECAGRAGNLFECLSKNSRLTLLPMQGTTSDHIYQIVFRPIERWK